MELLTVSSQREGIIVVVDANRNKKNVDALDWALKYVVRPRDFVIFIGVLHDFGKKNYPCFPLMNNMGISGIWERLDLSSGHGEVKPRQLGKELERKQEQYQNSLQPFHRQCKKNEMFVGERNYIESLSDVDMHLDSKQVKLEVKLAVGLCPGRLTVNEAKNSNIRLIVLDSHLKKHQEFIHEHVGCNVAIMKGNVATWMPLEFPRTKTSLQINCRRIDDGVSINYQPETLQCRSHGNPRDQEGKSSTQQPAPTPQTPHWYPLSWRSGFPRAFHLREVEEMTNGFADENKLQNRENVDIYEGVFQETPVMIKSFQETDERFWSMLMILSRVRHRNIMNLVGYCCTDTSRFILSDFPCLGTVHSNLFDDDSARKLSWKARWYMALEIGGSLRYLHEECGDGPIVHQSICSTHIVYSHGGSAMLCNFLTAKWLNLEDSSAEYPNSEKEEQLSVDVRDYGMFLVELITGKSATSFADEEGEGQSLVDWVVPLLKDGSLSKVMDPRLMNNTSDYRVVHYMSQAALLCLKTDDSAHTRPSISQVLAVVRGDELATSKC